MVDHKTGHNKLKRIEIMQSTSGYNGINVEINNKGNRENLQICGHLTTFSLINNELKKKFNKWFKQGSR